MKNRTAIYCRLSREDEKNSISTSIKNQQDFLIEYLKKNNFKLFKTYIDDGYSGGNFERPGFKSLIEDIKNNMKSLGALNALMSGSGPTVFGLFEKDDTALKAYEQCRQLYPDYQVELTDFVTREMKQA